MFTSFSLPVDPDFNSTILFTQPPMLRSDGRLLHVPQQSKFPQWALETSSMICDSESDNGIKVLIRNGIAIMATCLQTVYLRKKKGWKQKVPEFMAPEKRVATEDKFRRCKVSRRCLQRHSKYEGLGKRMLFTLVHFS